MLNETRRSTQFRASPLQSLARMGLSWIYRKHTVAIELIDGVLIHAENSDPCRCYPWTGELSLNVAALIRSLLKKGQTFIDVGAFVGQHTMRAAALVGNSGKVVAFEPDPRSNIKLRENISHTSLQHQIEIRNQAVGDTDKVSTFFLTPELSLSSLTISDSAKIHQEISVEVLSLRSVVQDYSPNLVKIDIEGNDAQAIQSLRGIPKSKIPTIIAEKNNGVKEAMTDLGMTVIDSRELISSKFNYMNYSEDLLGFFDDSLNLPLLKKSLNENLQELTYFPKFTFL